MKTGLREERDFSSPFFHKSPLYLNCALISRYGDEQNELCRDGRGLRNASTRAKSCDFDLLYKDEKFEKAAFLSGLK